MIPDELWKALPPQELLDSSTDSEEISSERVAPYTDGRGTRAHVTGLQFLTPEGHFCVSSSHGRLLLCDLESETVLRVFAPFEASTLSLRM